VKALRLIFVLSALALSGGDIYAASGDAVPVPAAKPDTSTSGKPAGPKSHEPKASESRASENKALENKASENKSSEKKPAENKASEKKSTDKKPVEKTADKKPADSKSANKTSAEHKPEQKSAAKKNAFAPLALRPSLSSPSIAANPSVPIRVNATTGVPTSRAALLPSLKPAPAFAMAASSTTSPLDIAAVKQAMDLAHHGRTDDATSTEGTISDPVARKLVEWVTLRADETDADFSRYSAFITANPSWPGIIALRRKAESVLWQDRTDPAAVIAFFRTEPPRTAKGKFALARAMMSQGNSAGAQQLVSESWRDDSFSSDIEDQARDAFAGLISPDDDKVRMDMRLYAEDGDAGLRAAQHLDSVQVAIAKARAAVFNKESNAKALFDAVPTSGQRDAGYLFSRIQLLRRNDAIDEAAHLMAAAPRDPAILLDVDQWWIERRLLARKLLDQGDVKLAYTIADDAATPVNENYRAEQQFTAGWIALRFLREPTMAFAHFAKIAEGVSNPITLARSFYWQGRATEAAGREQEARTYYETAAHYPTAYYGQLARARLGLDEVALRPPPAPPDDLHNLELARVFDILYAVDARDLIASMAADLADKANDEAALATLAEITTRHDDARATLLIGKIALGRGLPLEHYAFPDFGVPNFQQVGPQVERCVIYSIVRQESAFNPKVVSSANALGLMQVTPAAGRDTAKRFNVTFDQRRLLSDVAYNAQLGSAELGNDIASWRGSYILAFVAYNAGPRRAKEWIDQYGDPRDEKVDPVDWIERIPLSETRNYVQRIMENIQVYRARLDNSPRLMIEADLRRGG
jgi:soluble lytic murein transglycosylase